MQVQRGPAITDTALEMRHKQGLDGSFSFNVTLRRFLAGEELAVKLNVSAEQALLGGAVLPIEFRNGINGYSDSFWLGSDRT